MTNEQIFEELIQLEMVFREGKLRDEARQMARKRRTLLIDLLKVNQEEAATSAALQALCRAWVDELAGQTPEIELGSCLQGLDYPPDPAVMAEKLKIAAGAELGRQIAYRAPTGERDLAAVVFREAATLFPHRLKRATSLRPQAEWIDIRSDQKGAVGQMSLYYNKLGARAGFVVEWTPELRRACQDVGLSPERNNWEDGFYCFSFKSSMGFVDVGQTLEEAKRKLQGFLDSEEKSPDMGEDSDSIHACDEKKCKRRSGGQP